jgi:hypothetical protein
MRSRIEERPQRSGANYAEFSSFLPSDSRSDLFGVKADYNSEEFLALSRTRARGIA